MLSELFYHSVGEVTDKAVNTHGAESFDILIFIYSPGVDFTAIGVHFVNNLLTKADMPGVTALNISFFGVLAEVNEPVTCKEASLDFGSYLFTAFNSEVVE